MPNQCICQTCGRLFPIRPAKVALGRGKYCSVQCYRGDKSFLERFWERVEVCEHGLDCVYCCWPWHGTRTKAGYGSIGKKTEEGWTSILAHRLAWEILNNRELSPSLLGCHYCDTPSCCSGMHIHPGTYVTNMQEASIRNRIARGESKHGTKLHDVDIPRIFSMREQGMTYAAIAKEFGVNSITIGDILTYRSWMHISKNLGSYAMEEKRYNSKLTEGKILLIRQRYADGETQAAIAADLGISRPNISMIVNRKTWNHIP